MSTFDGTARGRDEEVGAELREAASEATDRACSVLRALPYAALGSAAVSLRLGREAFSFMARLPGEAIRSVWSVPGRIEALYDDRAERGRRIVSRVLDREAVRDAAAEAREAKEKVSGAAAGISSAARSAADAAEAAAEASVQPQDTRPYEDRTLEELRVLATEREVEGRSHLNKAELIRALRDAR